MTTDVIQPIDVRADRMRAIAPRTSLPARTSVAAMAGTGGALVILGALLPWLSLYAGLQPLRGTDGAHGLLLVALGGVAVAAAAAHLATSSPWPRRLLGLLGLVMVGLTGFLAIELARAYATLAADPLLVARVEPGLGAAALGAALVATSLFLPADGARADRTRRLPLGAQHVILAASLLLAGAVHLVLTREHMQESLALGLAFLGLGIVQTVLGFLVIVDRSRGVMVVVLGVSAASVVALALAVTLGLPFLPHGAEGGVLGPVESLDDLGAVTGFAELLATVVAVRAVRRGGLDS